MTFSWRLPNGSSPCPHVLARAFAEVVGCAVKLRCPELSCQVYTSTTDQEAKDDAIANVNTAWEDVDCVVASNSLESGISYEGQRFTEVGWLKQPHSHPQSIWCACRDRQ
jgi:hypothetical protein